VIIKDMRSSLKWMVGFFLASIVCFMGAYMSAGIAVLPPHTWSMIVSIILGGGACLIPITWILWQCTKGSLLPHWILLCQRILLPCYNEKDYPHQLGNSSRHDSPSHLQRGGSIQENHASLHRNSTFRDEESRSQPQSLLLPEYCKKLSDQHDKLWISLKIKKGQTVSKETQTVSKETQTPQINQISI